MLLVVLSSGCTTNTYSTWSESEQNKYKYFISLQALDSLQTYKGLKCTSDKTLTDLLIYAALTNESDLMSRNNTLNIMNTGITLVVINNQIVINRAF